MRGEAGGDKEGPRNRDERGGEKAGEGETEFIKEGERRREQGGDIEGLGQGDEQEVDGARKRKTTATSVESWVMTGCTLRRTRKAMLQRRGAASAGSTIKSAPHNTYTYVMRIHT